MERVQNLYRTRRQEALARKRTSAAGDLLDLVAMLPSWAGVSLALIGYLLHSIAAQPVVAAPQPGQMGAMLTQTLWKTLATFGQYLLPLNCLAVQAYLLGGAKEGEPRRGRYAQHGE